MFALPKLVLLILILAALWIFYRWVNNPMRELQRKRAAQPIPVEDLVACGVCGSYVASVAPSCPRSDCPRPR